MTVEADIQTLSPGKLVELYVLDTTMLGGLMYRFHSGVNTLGSDVVWQGNTYSRYPIEADGFEKSTKGALPTPRLRVANATGLVGALCKSLDDLVGATLTRKRTLAKYLDAVNFTGGVNPTADSNAHFSDEVWRVNRKVTENKLLVEFELASAMDVAGAKIPRRQVIANCCPWRYRSAECGWAGADYDINDLPTANPALDACAKRLTSCKARFGEYSELPYGGFPGAGRYR